MAGGGVHASKAVCASANPSQFRMRGWINDHLKKARRALKQIGVKATQTES
jgi:hypothetical protein